MIDDILLLRLVDLNESSCKGMVDRGMPGALNKLAMLGYAEESPSGGFFISAAGKDFLRAEETKAQLRKL